MGEESVKSQSTSKRRINTDDHEGINEPFDLQLKRKSKYSNIYAFGDLSFIRQDPKKKSKTSKGSTDKSQSENVATSSCNGAFTPENDNGESNPRCNIDNSVSTQTDELGSKFNLSEEDVNAIFVQKLISMIRYPKSTLHQQGAINLLRSDEELMKIVMREKKTNWKQLMHLLNGQENDIAVCNQEISSCVQARAGSKENSVSKDTPGPFALLKESPLLELILSTLLPDQFVHIQRATRNDDCLSQNAIEIHSSKHDVHRRHSSNQSQTDGCIKDDSFSGNTFPDDLAQLLEEYDFIPQME